MPPLDLDALTVAAAPATPQRALLCAVGALATRGEAEALSGTLRCYLAAGHDPTALYETVLQLHLFAGYPRAIEALTRLDAAWREAGLPPHAPCQEPPPGEALAGWFARGEALCGQIYGSAMDKLRAFMRRISPELACWMIADGYGKVLSRPGLDPAGREASVVGSLVALGTTPQLISHLRGSLRVGVSPEALAGLLRALALLLEPAAIQRARAALDEVLDRP